MQWWIDTLGKLVPAIITVLVLITTRQQNKWQNALAIRAGRIEDQKFRLALLERRMQAIDKVRLVAAEFWDDGPARDVTALHVTEALQIANLVFDERERVAIETLRRQFWQWHTLSRQMTALQEEEGEGEAKRFQQVTAKIDVLLGELGNGFNPILEQLQDAARISSVEPIVANQPFGVPKVLAWWRG